jgi:hypothetical protein
MATSHPSPPATTSSTSPPRGLDWRSVLVASVIALVLTVAAGLVVFLVTGSARPAGWALLGSLVLNALTYVVAAWFVASRRRVALAGLGLRPAPARFVLLGVAAGLAVKGVTIAVLLLLRRSGVAVGDAQASLFDLAEGSAAMLLGIVLVGGLLIPFAEELFYRGVWYEGLRPHFGFLPAALASALVFAAVHGLTVVFPVAFVLGLLNAWLYRRSGSLWPAVAAHVANNTSAFLLAAIIG